MFRKERYPKNWKAISVRIRTERAENRCECVGQCGDAHEGGRCDAPNGAIIKRDGKAPAIWTEHHHNTVCLGEKCGASKVILTVAHVNHVESDNREENLLALCQRCHLKLDSADNQMRRERKAAYAGQLPFPMLAVMPKHRRG